MGGAKPAKGAAKPTAAKGAVEDMSLVKDPALEMFRNSLKDATGSRVGEPEGAYQSEGGSTGGKKGGPKGEGESGAPRDSAAEAMTDRGIYREQPNPAAMWGGAIPPTKTATPGNKNKAPPAKPADAKAADPKAEMEQRKTEMDAETGRARPTVGAPKEAGEAGVPAPGGAGENDNEAAAAPGNKDSKISNDSKASFSPPKRDNGTTTNSNSKWSLVGTKVSDDHKSFFGGDAGKASAHSLGGGNGTADEVAVASTTPIAAESSVGTGTAGGAGESQDSTKPADASEVVLEEEADASGSVEETVEQVEVPTIKVTSEEQREIEKLENATAVSKKRNLEELRKSSVLFEEVEPASTASADAAAKAAPSNSNKRQKVEKAVKEVDEKIRTSFQEAVKAEVNNKPLSAEEIESMRLEEPISALDSPRMVAKKKKARGKIPHPHHARPGYKGLTQ